MTRLPDWQLRLEEFMRARERAPFAWGLHDCANFTAGAIEAITGQVLLPALRGLGVRDALRVLKRSGGLRGIAELALGPGVPLAFAAVGDVVLVRVGKREALGVCNGGVVVCAGLAGGVAAVGMRDGLAAWRVG